MFFQNDERHPEWIAMRGTKFETSFTKHHQDGWYTVPENIFYIAKTHALQMVSPEKTNRRKPVSVMVNLARLDLLYLLPFG